ncbi:hypothetical protein [Streptococcus merionis]|uniref:hypothetical protein n=1 Tax=Streptococcus merionis TaxID=400065 RepID=UPI003518D992
MIEWKTLKEVAEELGISKDLIKYHRKHLEPLDLVKENGQYYISPARVETIRSHVRKESCDATFDAALTNDRATARSDVQSLDLVSINYITSHN